MGQIGESFEQIGQDVVRETVQAPKDIAGKALESLGVSSGKKNPKQQTAQAATPQTPEEQQQASQDEETKRAIARAALEELSGKKPAQKEQTVWEKIQQEEEQKKELKKQQNAQAARANLPQPSSKRKRGDLFGMKAKKTSTENRNVRQD